MAKDEGAVQPPEAYRNSEHEREEKRLIDKLAEMHESVGMAHHSGHAHAHHPPARES